MRINKQTTIITAIITFTFNSFSQGGIPGIGNTSTLFNFLGFNTIFPSINAPLNIRNDFDNFITLRTAGPTLERMRINHRGPGLVLPGYGPFSMINPYPGNRLTRIGISIDGNSPITLPMAALHIGYDWLPGAGVQGGFRDWMNIGTMYMEGTDQMYVGLREKSQFDITGRTSALSVTQQDGQDAVINWGDNFSFENTAPNNLTFIFTSVRNNANNFANTAYGREVARMTPEGNMGIGPVFFDNAQPQSMLHINNNAANNAFMQITNAGSSSQTTNDGIKFGIEGATANAFLYNQENRPLMFSTNALPTNYNVGHRVMITNLGSATQPVGGIGNTNPGGLANNLTRVSISHNPAQPVTRPLSLLHLGYNTGNVINPASTDGWRPWMDVGMYISNQTDNVYLGLKPEPSLIGTDRQDAVLGWGDNLQTSPPIPGLIGPDRFRIIFTTPQTAPYAGPGAMSGVNGLEFARFVPNTLNGNAIADPRIGFGDFFTLGNLDPNNTIEINTPLGPGGNLGAGVNAPFIPGSWPGSTGASGLRFRDLTSLSIPVPTLAYATATINPNKVLTVDGNGDVVLINAAGSVQTNNGISTNSLGVVQLGIDCPSPSPTTTAASQLINDRQIPMANFNFCFNNPVAPNTPFGTPGNNAGNNVGIGTNNCTPGNRLEVNRNTGTNPTSGLRLTDLAGATPLPTNNQVLSVDANGDVILTTVPTSSTASVVVNNGLSINNGTVQLGIPCNSVPNPTLAALYQLTTDRQIPMNGFNFVFTNTVAAPAPFTGLGDKVGIGTACNPGNRLEVDRNTGLDNVSGLRLTQFALGAPTTTLFQNRVLSVDASGDVILSTITSNTSTGIGNYCNQPQNPLVGSDYEVPLGTFKYRFTGQSVIAPSPGLQQDMVSIGYPCNTPLPVAKFSVLESQAIQPVNYENHASHFKNENQPGVGVSYIASGVYGEAKAAMTGLNFSEQINAGGVFEGYNTFCNVGVIGRVSKTSMPNKLIAAGGYAIGGAFMSDTLTTNPFGIPSSNYGVYGRASNSSVANFGVYGEVFGTTAVPAKYAVFGETNFIAGAPGTGTPGGPTYAGYFNGDVYIAGTYGPSDQMLKQNIDTITNALGIINQLQPKTFDFNQGAYPSMSLPSGLQYGLIAQQVQTVIPAIVTENQHPAKYNNGVMVAPQVNFKGLEYQQLIPILIRAVQQLSSQNRRQDSLIQVLTQNINACCENNQARQTGISGNNKSDVKNILNVDLTDKDVIVLNQNVPNPFAERTTITYNVPEQYKFAQIIFKTVEGKIIRAVDIEKKGRGQLNVFADDLSNGLYMYSLIVDGVLIDTKKMIKQ